MKVGDLVDVYDGDLRRFVPCRLDSIGDVEISGVSTEVRVFRPLDETMTDPGSGLRLIYGIPWPDGEHLTKRPRR